MRWKRAAQPARKPPLLARHHARPPGLSVRVRVRVRVGVRVRVRGEGEGEGERG